MTPLNATYNHVPLGARLELLVGNKLRSDFTFIIEDDNAEIPAHKLIIALASPVLDRIVYGRTDTFTTTDNVRVGGISKESFMELLHFIYTDTLNLDDDNVFEILHKSHYFALSGIEMKCFEYLEKRLNVISVPWIYHQLFHTFPSSQVLRKCLQYIRIMPLSFFASEYFDQISVDELKSILQMNAMNCTEVDLFRAMIKLSIAHCAAVGLEQIVANQRKVLDGAEQLLRLESLNESEFDECLGIQEDFYSTKDIAIIRAGIRRASPAVVKRKWYTYDDSVWMKAADDGRENIPGLFYSGSHTFIYRCCPKDGEPLISVCSAEFFYISFATTEVLCGSGYEWLKCVNEEIPFGSVSISTKDLEPVFIAREVGNKFNVGTVCMNGTAYMNSTRYRPTTDRFNGHHESCEFEILVAKNVKNPYNGNGVPSDGIFVGYDENNYKTYLGKAWHDRDLLPAKIIVELGAFVPYGALEEKVDRFEFVRMDPGTYKWEVTMDGEIPANAVLAGLARDYQDLFFGRVMHNGNYIHGKVHPGHMSFQAPFTALYVPYRGQEISFQSFEILVHVDGNESEMATI